MTDQRQRAHLIAAAPDLYEALERTSHALQMAIDDLQAAATKMYGEDFNSPIMNVALVDARAALAKARGET